MTTARQRSSNPSLKILKLLAWLRDNEHHMAGIFPTHSAPGKHTHLIIRGENGRRKIPAAVAEVLFQFLKPADYMKTKRMYVVTPRAKKLLAAAKL